MCIAKHRLFPVKVNTKEKHTVHGVYFNNIVILSKNVENGRRVRIVRSLVIWRLEALYL